MKGKIFNAQEVQAIISGNKTQFREVIKKQPQPNGGKGYHPVFPYKTPSQRWNWVLDTGMGTGDPFHAPYQVGQKIFVKESFLYGAKGRIGFADFKLIGYYSSDWQKKPAQHMKQEHSRLTLQIKSIGVERLQDITLGDVIKEGTSIIGGWDSEDIVFDRFQEAWNATHKKPEEKFEANPWVWVVSCEVVK